MHAVVVWSVLTLLFVDEVPATVAVGVWGQDRAGWRLAVAAPAAVLVLWWASASPKAPYGSPVARPLRRTLRGAGRSGRAGATPA